LKYSPTVPLRVQVLASKRTVPKAVALAMGYVSRPPASHRFAAEMDVALKQKVLEALL